MKIGRTHLQDAMPMRLGQEFSGYARQVEMSAASGFARRWMGLYELALGGTAVGTGLNAPPGFAAAAIAEIAERTGLPFREARESFRGAGGARTPCVPERRAEDLCGRADQDRATIFAGWARVRAAGWASCDCRPRSPDRASCRAR